MLEGVKCEGKWFKIGSYKKKHIMKGMRMNK